MDTQRRVLATNDKESGGDNPESKVVLHEAAIPKHHWQACTVSGIPWRPAKLQRNNLAADTILNSSQVGPGVWQFCFWVSCLKILLGALSVR